eukprot:Clim_evm8s86 gene=Clim_evmTU8s86
MRLESAVFAGWLLLFVVGVEGEVYFKETFADGENYKTRWVQSESKVDYGAFKLGTPGVYSSVDTDTGLQTTEDYHHYAISTKFPESFSNKDKSLVLQFQIAHDQIIDCGGGYIKLLNGKFEPKQFNAETDMEIMFGPDICGQTRQTHVVLNKNGTGYLIKHDIIPPVDRKAHVYTLVLTPENRYGVYIDGLEVRKGQISDSWAILPPQKIRDPEAVKPEHWDDREQVPDRAATKPDNWDDRRLIVKPDTHKPEGWDDDIDGEWQTPMVANPDYKGEWQPPMIPNSEYQGQWVHPMIDNPEYKEDTELYQVQDIGGIGIEIWQVKSGSVFDNIIITDSLDEAFSFMKSTWKPLKGAQDAREKLILEDSSAPWNMNPHTRKGKKTIDEDVDYDEL